MISVCPGAHAPGCTLTPCFAGWAIVQNLGMRSLLGRIDFLLKAGSAIETMAVMSFGEKLWAQS